MTTFIGYCRVSSAAQGKSQLGLEAQHESITSYCEREGLELVRIDTEVASGGLDETRRLVLGGIIQEAQNGKATIIVSKLCRLSRDHFFIKRMSRELKVDFLSVESPNASPLELGMRAEFDEEYRTKISEGTKAALAAKRARGETLGNIRNLELHAHKGHETRRRQAITEIEPYRFVMSECIGMSLSEAARQLNARMVKTPRGGLWNHRQVSRALNRLELV